MPNVLVMGRHSAILPFRAVGVELCDVDSVEEARAEMRKLHEADEETLLLVPEDIAVGCKHEIALLRQGVSVVVMTLPATSGEVGIQREEVRQLVARSLGVDLMRSKSAKGGGD